MADEVKRIESLPYNFVLYSDGEIRISSMGKFIEKPSVTLLAEARKALGVAAKPHIEIRQMENKKWIIFIDTIPFRHMRRMGYEEFIEFKTKKAAQDFVRSEVIPKLKAEKLKKKKDELNIGGCKYGLRRVGKRLYAKRLEKRCVPTGGTSK